MRSPAISLLFLAIACSGNSLNVGSDDSATGGGSGDDSVSGGKAGGATAGATSRGGSSAGGASGAEAGEPGTGGIAGIAGATAGVGGSVEPRGGTSGSAATPPITSCTGEFRFAGEWRGNILDFYYEPQEELRLSIRAQGGAGGYTGTVTWGEGDPPPPATDGNAPYPPGLATGRGTGGTGGGSGVGSEPWPGFPYTVVRGAGCDAGFRLSVSVYQTWDSWCALQEPIYSESLGSYNCLVATTSGSSDGTTCRVLDENERVIAEYPQWKCDLCGPFGRVCACTEAGCSYDPGPTHTFELTLIQSGGVDVLSGPDPDSNCSNCTVRLERVE
jgi:hypothetical protein